jgi:hypothetical protein
MVQVCRLCSRVNPAEALYCYYDGAPLDAALSAPLAVGRQPFGHPFIFPSGRNCRNFDELVLACEDDWEAGKDMLRRGFLTSFLDAVGRPDLAHVARQSAKVRDRDHGLDQLLKQLPCTARLNASLVVQPLEINLGQLIDATAPKFSLHLFNHGGGMIYGSVTAEADWLTLGDAPGSPRKLFQFHHDCEVTAQVVRKNLRASPKPIDGRLVVETNAGLAVVMVRIEVPNQPFPRGVLAGATTPRDLAKKAKRSPKKAAHLFESGAVRQWYEANGWTYPIPKGHAVSGLASVQQYFEALGLVKPPRVVVGEHRVQLSGKPGEALQHILHLHAAEKKYIFVQARSTVGWLKIGGTTTAGQRAQVLLRVPKVPSLPGNRLHGFVQITANGGQRFAVEVHLTVAGARQKDEVEVIPVAGLEELKAVVAKEEVLEVIPIAPMKLEDLLDPIPVDPDEQLTGEGHEYE